MKTDNLRMPMPVQELKVGDKITIPFTTVPRWWQFWKKPVVRAETFVCTASCSSATGLGNRAE